MNDFLRIPTAITINELLAYQDGDFVRNAYLNLLGREPDSEGSNYYLTNLRRGISKTQILAEIRSSKESMNKQVDIIGIDKLVQLYKWKKLPFFKIIVHFFIKTGKKSKLQKELQIINNKLDFLSCQLVKIKQLILQEKKHEIDERKLIDSRLIAELHEMKKLSPRAFEIYRQLRMETIV